MENLYLILLATVLSPILTHYAKRLPIAEDVEAWAAVNLGIAVGLALLLWLAADRDPAHVPAWITQGLAAGGVSGAANNLYRKNVLKTGAGEPDEGDSLPSRGNDASREPRI